MSRLECERWASLLDREALAGSLSREEAAFQAAHVRSCEACAEELSAWHELRSMDPTRAPALERDLPLEDAVLKELWNQPRVGRDPKARKRSLVIGGCAVLAAAATLLLVLRRPEAPGIEAPLARVTIASGNLSSVSGARRHPGEAAHVGELLSAAEKPACLLVEPGIRACLSAGGSLRLDEATLVQRRIHVLEGRLVVSLDPQPAGSSFSVSTAAATVTAIGTIFAVEVTSGGERVVVRVLKGAVSVRDRAEKERRLAAHQSLSFGVEAPASVTQDQEASDLALLRMDGEPQAASDQVELPEPTGDAAKAGPEARAPSALPVPSPAEPVTAGNLLREALELRGKGRFAEAAQVYQKLLTRFPGSSEGRAALVSLGDLQLSRLQMADAALRSFDAYLKSGDRALAQEAEYGRIRAFRALGRAAEEQRAIEQLLARYPSGVHADSMRARLQSLKGNAPR